MLREVQEKDRAIGIIPLCIETLPLIKVGMYWYEGNEFSWKFLPERHLKAVVLFVRGRTVYGDCFMEEEKSVTEISSLISSGVVLLSAFEHSMIAESIPEVNRVLSAANKPLWKGTYLTSSDSYHQFWVVSYPSGDRSMRSKTYKGKIRKVSKCFVD